MANLKKVTAPIGVRLFLNGKKISEDAQVTLPNIQPMTVDLQALGNLSYPLVGLLQDAEFSINQTGITKHYGEVNVFDKVSFEFRWVDIHVDDQGNEKHYGKKAFLVGRMKSSGAPQLQIGNETSLEGTYAMISYKLVDDGKTVIDIDRFAKKIIINGKNYYDDIGKLLD